MSTNTRPTAGRRERAPRRCSIEECHTRADRYLIDLIGAPPDDLCWDPTHQLQGHAHLGHHELIVIAPRDDAHDPVVLTADDWDEIRHTPADVKGALIERRAIHDHDHLLAALATDHPENRRKL